MHGLADASVAGFRRKENRRRVQDMTLKRRRDVDAFVTGATTAKDQVPKVLTCARSATRKAIVQEIAEDQEKEQGKERKVMMAREQVKAKVLSRNTMATVETVESTVTGLELVGQHFQRSQQRRVKEVEERQASERS